MPAALPDLFKPLEDRAHVALAVSGGSDSVCLMHLAWQWSQERGGRPRLTVLTVDHGLRPEAADEARQVSGWAGRLGLAHVTLKWTASKPSTGIQAAARQARYDLMTAYCAAHGAEALLTGHTLDDQAETVLMRLGRTSSIDSLAGIAPAGMWKGIPLVRPLLGLDREQLRGHLRTKHLPWIDDPSNADERFERVRVRNALPGLQGLGITQRQLADLASECREAAEALGAMAQGFCEDHVTVHSRGYATFPLEGFLRLAPAVRLRVLRQLLPRFGSGNLPLRSEIARLAASLDNSGCKQTLGGAIVWRRRQEVLIAREAGRIAAAPVIVPASGAIVWDRRFEVCAPPGHAVVAGQYASRQERKEGFPRLVQDAEPAVLDGSARTVPVDFSGAGPVRARFLSLNSP